MANLVYNYTDVEQAKQLAKLGLDPNTSDMYYETVTSPQTGRSYYHTKLGSSPAIQRELYSYRKGYIIPCWSVGALLKVLPSYVIQQYPQTGQPPLLTGKVVVWSCGVNSGEQDSLIDACCELVVRLIENKEIKTKEE